MVLNKPLAMLKWFLIFPIGRVHQKFDMFEKTYVAKCACKCDNCDNRLLKNRHKYGTIEVPCRASLQLSPLLFNLCQSTVLTEIAILGLNTYFLPVVSMLCSW